MNPRNAADRLAGLLVLGMLSVISCSRPASDATSTTAPEAGDAATAEASDDTGDDGPPPCTAEVNKGPWVVAFDETSARLRWESCVTTPGTVTLVPEMGGATRNLTATVATVTTSDTVYTFGGGTDWASTWYENEVAISGLSASTCYVWSIDRDPTARGRFCTARRSGEAFTFAAVGDTNPGLADNMKQVESQVFSGGYPIDFTVHTGDIQYYASLVESYQSWFGWMAPLLRRGAFMPAIGNHESEEPHELDEMVLRFWGGAGFDGQPLYYDFHSGGVWFFTLDTELDLTASAPQIQWLAARLAAVSALPDYRFSVVYQHRPMFTCGDSDDHTDEQAYLEPLFLKYKVPLVLWGHMHGYERFAKSGVTYVTTAGGGGEIADVNKNASRSYCGLRQKAGPWFHAMVFDVNAAGLHGRAIDRTGAVVDEFDVAAP